MVAALAERWSCRARIFLDSTTISLISFLCFNALFLSTGAGELLTAVASSSLVVYVIFGSHIIMAFMSAEYPSLLLVSGVTGAHNMAMSVAIVRYHEGVWWILLFLLCFAFIVTLRVHAAKACRLTC